MSHSLRSNADVGSQPQAEACLQARFAQAARPTLISAWSCAACGKTYFVEIRARECCCGVRQCSRCKGLFAASGFQAVCDGCVARLDPERWLGKDLCEWDGQLPLFNNVSDRFFFDEDDLLEHVSDLSPEDVAEMRLSPCVENKPREFLMSEFLEDELPTDFDSLPGEEAINRTVNEWIEAHRPFSFVPDPRRRLDALAVLKSLGWTPASAANETETEIETETSVASPPDLNGAADSRPDRREGDDSDG